MKCFIALVCLLSSWHVMCQAWQVTSIPQNESGQRYDDVFFFDEDLGWAANGYFAAVYKTTDGGLTWSEQINESDLGSNQYFRNIEFITKEIGFLGTLNGKFYKTIDGGINWSLVDINPNPPAICGLSGVDENTIYGCGAYFTPAFIIKSVDQGRSWTYIDMSAYAEALVEVKFVDANLGYVSGYNAAGACILKTYDGGKSWTEVYNSTLSGQYVWKLQILDSDSDVLFGSIESMSPNPGKLIKTFDAGASWIELNAPEYEIQAVGFVSETKGWMGGHNTGLYETLDGGETWNNLNIGSNMNRIFVLDEGLAFAAGTSIYKYTQESLHIKELHPSNSHKLKVEITKNPVGSTLDFTVEFESPDQILTELYDNQGRLIKHLDKSSILHASNIKYSYNVQDLATGTYILSLHNNFNRQSFTFIKE